MRVHKYGWLMLLFCCFAATFSTSAGTVKNTAAQHCGVDQDRPAQRIFSSPDGTLWREYQNIKDVPEVQPDVGGEFVRLWTGDGGNTLISLEEPGQDFIAYTDYCFDKTGKLVHLRFELRTAWEWGYRQEARMVKGALAVETSEFFDTKKEQSIKKPEQANDIAAALKPKLYIRKSKLPFSSLLSR